jgi:mono/diheme cytochrome c family protein
MERLCATCAGLFSLMAVPLSWAQAPVTTPLTVTTRAYDKKQLLADPGLSAEARKGRSLWLQRCAFCHDGVGQPTYRTMGPWLGADTVQQLGPLAMRAIIDVGTERMPGFRYTLQPQQVTQLIEFLKTIPADQKPTAEQLSRKSPGAAAQISGE